MPDVQGTEFEWPEATIVVPRGVTSLRAAAGREPQPKLDPNRQRIKCEFCWSEAHETRGAMALCPSCAQLWDADEPEPSQDGPGQAIAPEVAPTAAPRRPTPPEYTPEAMAAAAKEESDERHARRRADLERRGIPGRVVGTKSKLGQTREYRTIEKRRTVARQKGLDPNTLGPDYRLPRRGDTRKVRDLRAGLVGSGMFKPDELDGLDLRPLVD